MLLYICNSTLKSSKRKASTLKSADLKQLLSYFSKKKKVKMIKGLGLYTNKYCEYFSFVFCCCDKNTLMKEARGGGSLVSQSPSPQKCPGGGKNLKQPVPSYLP